MISYDRHPGIGRHRIVLLHSLALDRSVWDGLIEELHDEGAEILALDLPGHGKSHNFSGDSIEEISEEVADLVAAEEFGPAIVIGLSLGGCVAQALAIRYPHLVSGLGLLDTTCWYGEGAPEAWEERAQRARRDGLASLAAFQLARWFSAGFLETQTGLEDRLLGVFRSTDIDSYSAACKSMGALDLRNAVAQIQVPTAIIVGADDPATTPAHSEDLLRRIPGSSLHIIPNCSHLSAVERPAEVARLLESNLFPRV